MSTVVSEELGSTKVSDLDVPFFVQEDVLRFEIPLHTQQQQQQQTTLKLTFCIH